MNALTVTKPFRTGRLMQWGLLAVLVGSLSVVIGQSPPLPLVKLAPEPLYMNGAKTKANLTLALSVERPTVGQTYAGNVDPKDSRNLIPANNYDPAKKYLGYFDHKYCYKQSPGKPFRTGNLPVNGKCNGAEFHGNFMNWATSSAIDIMRMGLTGGNRIVDDSHGNGETVLERAYLPDLFYRSNLFQARWISHAAARDLVDQDLYQEIPTTGAWIYNCRNRVYFANKPDIEPRPNPPKNDQGFWDPGNCDQPFNKPLDGKHPDIIGGGKDEFYPVQVEVCDPKSASSRLMKQDPNTKKWGGDHGLCFEYNGKYKPVGQLQMNADAVRVSVFSYVQDNDRKRYGGVLRAPLKYLGPHKYDANFNLIAGTNGQAEWDPQTGVFKDNPQSGDATYGDQGFVRSGVINYLNKFGTLDPNAMGVYKETDPVGELYYEALRYLQGKQPTLKALDCPGCTAAQVKTLKEQFPAYSSWADPFAGFVDTTGKGPSCLRNSIVTIADVFTNNDREIPGNTMAPTGDKIDFARAAETTPALNVMEWTRIVGSFETQIATTNKTYSYTDSQNRPRTALNLPTHDPKNAILQVLEYADVAETGSEDKGSFYIAGLAYFANTQSFRTDFPMARVKTYAIDVDENGASSSSQPWRQTRQLHLAAKYGGFDDKAQDGNPYSNGTNSSWQGAGGDAKNYFLASDAEKFLDSIAEVFGRVVEESATIAGGAISSQRVTSSSTSDVFFAKFNPESNYWSGRVLKYGVKLVNSQLEIDALPQWEAGEVMMTDTKIDKGASRKIFVGPALGKQGVEAPTKFAWNDLSTTHQTALNTPPNKTVDALGQDRLGYLRGNQAREIGTNPAGVFRARDKVLGDIVNSGLVYMGAPDFASLGYMDNKNTVGYAARRTFVNTNAGRKSVIFVNANDGMLHAFDDVTGKEVFAYIPGFLVPKLSALPEPNYKHQSLADATPAVQDAYFRGAWGTALVSGVGGGAQGVYALDVSDPAKVSENSVLWEFTDRDHPALGNVVGTPHILKFRLQDAKDATHTYKYFAVVASGVNNYDPNDGPAHATGNASLFFFDLNYIPSPTNPWKEGTNFWRVEMPQPLNTMAMGITGFNSTTEFARNTVNALYAGDLQGNLWKLDFSKFGFNRMGANAGSNFDQFNFRKVAGTASSKPLFVAKAANGTSLQPITGTPEIVHAYGGNKLVVFGTGKFMEASDTNLPLVPPASFYAVLDDGENPVAGRSSLEKGTVSSTGTVTVPNFTLGNGASNKAGWYLDLDAALGERQVSDIVPIGGRLVFGSVYPTQGACGPGGGITYSVDALTGDGKSEVSTVGVMAAPLVVNMGSATPSATGTTGRRTMTEKFGVISQGSKGLAVSGVTDSYSYEAGRLSWRQINNYHARKAQ